MMILLVIIISYSGLLVSSASNLPFLYPITYSTVNNELDYAVHVLLPSAFQFGSSYYNDTYVSRYSVYMYLLTHLLCRLVPMG